MNDEKMRGLKEMSTEELEKMIRQDCAGDEEQTLAVLAELADRQKSPEEWETQTREAYDSFRQDYLPAAGGESLYEEAAPKRLPLKRILAAAAAVAVVLTGAWALDLRGWTDALISAWTPAQTEPSETVQPRQFQLVNLSDSAVAITDEENNCAALGVVTLEKYAITASIDAMRLDDGYEYTALVTYTYYTNENGIGGSLRSESILLTTAEEGSQVTRITYRPEYIGQICEASVSFTAVEKGGKNTVLENAQVHFSNVQ